jgi:hypothetical protein
MSRFSFVEGRSNVEGFKLFYRAKDRGCSRSAWVIDVIGGVSNWDDHVALQKAFEKTNDPWGLYFAGRYAPAFTEEQVALYLASCKGGCSWGQLEYALVFHFDEYGGERREDLLLEYLEKSGAQNNPEALDWLSRVYGWRGDQSNEFLYAKKASICGNVFSMTSLATFYCQGRVCPRDLRRALQWSARCHNPGGIAFWSLVASVRKKSDFQAGEFDQFAFGVGWGMYWICAGESPPQQWKGTVGSFAELCLDYYCSCIEMQQKSIFTFLFFWNRMVQVKDVGTMIAKMVWEEREESLVKSFVKYK